MDKTRNPGKIRNTSEKLMRADALAFVRRFPAQGRADVILNVALVLVGNGIVLWLVLSGRMRAAHLIALTLVETILLIALSWMWQRTVPRRDWLEQPKPWREKAPVIAFALVWIGFAYAITLLIVEGYGDVLPLLHSLRAWREAGLHWPLLFTLALAVVHGIGDLRHYRASGGPFVSSVAMDAMARYLTLILGGIPFAMPFFAAAIGGFKAVEYVARKARVAPEQSLLAGGAMLAVAYGSFALVTLLTSSGVAGWAIGFVFAKLIAEVLIACIPLVMAHVARQGEAGSGHAASIQKSERGDGAP